MVLAQVALDLRHDQILDRFTRSDWLVHGAVAWSDLAPVLGQSVVYVTLLATAGLFDLYRRSL